MSSPSDTTRHIQVERREFQFHLDADKSRTRGSRQLKLRILSGQYGVLKPLDLMQPYRLEMGTKLKIRTKDNLYQFWGDKITKALNEELEEEPSKERC